MPSRASYPREAAAGSARPAADARWFVRRRGSSSCRLSSWWLSYAHAASFSERESQAARESHVERAAAAACSVRCEAWSDGRADPRLPAQTRTRRGTAQSLRLFRFASWSSGLSRSNACATPGLKTLGVLRGRDAGGTKIAARRQESSAVYGCEGEVRFRN